MSDREEIADAIMSTHRVERHPELRRANSLVEADAILNSDWLARHDTQVAAKSLEDAASETYEVKITGQNKERRSEQRPIHAKATREHLEARAAAIRAEGAPSD